eukprot:3196689-Amphidinium_carterae.1
MNDNYRSRTSHRKHTTKEVAKRHGSTLGYEMSCGHSILSFDATSRSKSPLLSVFVNCCL